MNQRDQAAQVEAVLARHPRLAQARVAVRAADQSVGAESLIAYLVPQPGAEQQPDSRELKFSLFYFADADAALRDDKYRLYLEGATFADQHQFEAVWTPERHFHENGGLYPNPAVLSAALATITRHVGLRAGSVALPLHHPLRVAEEWSVVDNLSKGRVGVSFTSGWIPNDFAIAPRPESFKTKREVMLQGIEQVQHLWQGHKLATRDGVGNEVELEIFPKPVQPQLPIWLTCSGDPAMFERAGALGLNVLTALLAQSLDETAQKIALYRNALAQHGRDPRTGRVTLMLHTFIGADEAAVREQVRQPLINYLKSHLDLMKTMFSSLNTRLEQIDTNDPIWLDYAAAFAFERYYQAGSLLGTPTRCLPMINRLKEIGVDEVACLIDFGVAVDAVLESLVHLNQLKKLSNRTALTEFGLRQFLTEALPAELGPITFEFLPELPATPTASEGTHSNSAASAGANDLAAPAYPRPALANDSAQGPAAEAMRTVEERVKLQKAARDRQQQMLRKGMESL